MKRICALLVFLCLAGPWLFAQGTDMQLAQQYYANGEFQKAAEIFQKLYKQDNEAFFTLYINSLMGLKKLDEAESVTKKIIKKHPGEYQYSIMLGRIYKEQGSNPKADALYNDLIKNLPADQGAITNLAAQFYQAENADYAVKIFLQGRKLMHNDQVFTMELISLYRFKRDKASLVEEYLNFLPANPAYISQMENTLSTMFDNPDDYDILKTQLLRLIQKDPQQTIFAELLTWQYLQQKDFDQALNQALALSRRRNDDGTSIMELCQTLNANEAYDAAIRGYEYLVAKGKKESQIYIQAKIELINTKNLKITSGKYQQADLVSLETDYIDLLNEFGRTEATAFAMQKLAKLQAFKLHKLNDAQKVLEQTIALPRITPDLLASCKLDLGDIYLLNSQPWEATLLYSQVEKANPASIVGQDAKLRNAKLAYYTGDFAWATGQLDILKAATSQLIANDALNLSLLIKDNTGIDSAGNALKIYARADLLIFKEQPEKAFITLDSIDKKYPGNSLTDDILMAKARIFIQQKNYNEAIAPLKKITEDHKSELWADDAVFMLGDLYDNFLNNKEQAKIYYQKIITDYPGSLWINEARKRFRILRGDKLNGAS